MPKTYPAKILLFGEYTVIQGGMALAIPLLSHGCIWSTKASTESLESLSLLMEFIKSKDIEGFDLHTWSKELSEGVGLVSTIKFGYGMGSSGAVTAAVIDRYYPKARELSYQAIHHLMCSIENCFHGRSSGIDPMVSYHRVPIIKDDVGQFRIQELSDMEEDQWVLVDSGQMRHTAALVDHYLAISGHSDISPKIEQLKTHVHQGIHSQIAGDRDNLFTQVHHISHIQRKVFDKMITANIKPLWDACLEGDMHRLKLCGAGGGGYFLALTKDVEALQAMTALQLTTLDI